MQKNQWDRAIAIAKRDHIQPIPCTRQDTGDTIWLVKSRSQAGNYYLLTRTEDRIHCPCPAAQNEQTCAHAAAIHLLLQVQRPSKHSTPRSRNTFRRQSASSSAEEGQRREEALRRERALLWTDDKPFSIWKS
jgi:hypothetical protein